MSADESQDAKSSRWKWCGLAAAALLSYLAWRTPSATAPASTTPVSAASRQVSPVAETVADPYDLLPLPSIDQSAGYAEPPAFDPNALVALPAPESETPENVVPTAPGAAVPSPKNTAQPSAAAKPQFAVGETPPGVNSLPPQFQQINQIVVARQLLADAGPCMTGSPTGNTVCQRAAEKIRRAAELSQRGALFASRAELLEVLRMIAEAKDQRAGAARRTVALSDGLRAMEEAKDFVSRSADANPTEGLDVILSSHRTPIGRHPATRGMIAQQLADLYFRYAQVQLGAAVANEPAGSMALHSLGKLYSQFEQLDPEAFAQADRRAFAMQQAALIARPDNTLAAHELAVLLAESGHLVPAEQLLVRVTRSEPSPTGLKNLARVQRQLGRSDYAAANERQADMLAARVPPGGGSVAWMPPGQFSQTGRIDAPPGGAVQNAGRPTQQMMR